MYSLNHLESNYIDYFMDVKWNPIFAEYGGCFPIYLDMGFKFYPKEKWPELTDADIRFAHEEMLKEYGMNYITYMKWKPDYWSQDDDMRYEMLILEETKQPINSKGLSHRERYKLYEEMLKGSSCYEEILKRAAVLPESHIELLQKGELPKVSNQDLIPFLLIY